MSRGDDQAQDTAALLLGHFTPERLGALVEQRRYHHVPGLLGQNCILSLADLEQALSEGRFRKNQLRLAQGRSIVDPEVFRATDGSRINPGVLRQLLDQGAIAVFNNLEQTFPVIAQAATALAQRLGVWVEAVVVLNLTARSGLPAHHDIDNVFILQLEGDKDWEMLGEPLPPGVPVKDAVVDAPGTMLTMRPGDALFLPAGQQHQCHASPNGSLHLAFLLQAPSAKVAVDALERAMREDNELLAPLLPLGADAEAARIKAIRDRLHRHVDAIDIAALLERERRRGRADPDFKLRFGGKGAR